MAFHLHERDQRASPSALPFWVPVPTSRCEVALHSGQGILEFKKKKKINSPPIWCSLNSGLPQSTCYHLLSRVFKQVLNAFCPHCIIKRYRVYILPETLVCYFALQIFYCTCHDCLLGGSIRTCGCTFNFC